MPTAKGGHVKAPHDANDPPQRFEADKGPSSPALPADGAVGFYGFQPFAGFGLDDAGIRG